jgi:esterase/lipase superfamily enzyme
VSLRNYSKYEGVTIVYSWPSEGATLSYTNSD